MSTTRIERVCIVGSGFMGSQIALQSVFHGFDTWVVGRWTQSLERSLKTIHSHIHGMQGWSEASDERVDAALGRLHMTLRPADGLHEADLCIEAVSESLEMKQDVFRLMDEYAPSHAIFATNSSSMLVSEVGSAAKRPDRMLNMLFYSRVWERPLVELMRGPGTSDETMKKVSHFAKAAGLFPLVVLKESRRFVFGSVWRAVRRESLHAVDEGLGSIEDVDRAWMVFTGMSIGPFGLMDLMGLDVVKEIELARYAESKDPRDAPPDLLLDRVETGALGVKSGRGFYRYPHPEFEKPGWLKRPSDELVSTEGARGKPAAPSRAGS